MASSPGDPLVELFVERLPDGEVSTHLADVVEPGDLLEVRGPIGGWFVWDGATPALLLGGGFGVVPFVSMLRTARELGGTDLLRIAASSRTLSGLPYSDDLIEAGALIALTRIEYGIRPAGRLTPEDLVPLWEPGQTAYVCGSASFAQGGRRPAGGHGRPAVRDPGRAVRADRHWLNRAGLGRPARMTTTAPEVPTSGTPARSPLDPRWWSASRRW